MTKPALIRAVALALCVFVLSPLAEARESSHSAPAPDAGATQTQPPDAIEDFAEADRAKSLCLATRSTNQVYFTGDAVAIAAAKATFATERTAAMARLYRSRIPADGFKLGEFDADAGKLAIDLGMPMRMLHGAVTLVFPSDSPVEFQIEPAKVNDVTAALKTKTATLVAYFELNDDQGAVCTGSIAAGVFTLAVLPVLFDLRDDKGNSLARAETPRSDRFRSLIGGYSGKPEISLGTIEGDTNEAASSVYKKMTGVTDSLRTCYAERLKTRPDAGGTVVMGVTIKDDGKVDTITYIADALGDDPLRKCVDTELHNASFAGVPGLPTRVRIPIEFRLSRSR